MTRPRSGGDSPVDGVLVALVDVRDGGGGRGQVIGAHLAGRSVIAEAVVGRLLLLGGGDGGGRRAVVHGRAEVSRSGGRLGHAHRVVRSGERGPVRRVRVPVHGLHAAVVRRR